MAKYNYSKYNIKTENVVARNGYKECHIHVRTNRGEDSTNYDIEAYNSLTVSSGIISGNGLTVYRGFAVRDIPRGKYVKETNEWYEIVKYLRDYSTGTNVERTYYVFDAYLMKISTQKVRGVFVETVIAEDGTYPDNGISGSYWYVKQGLANSPPTISGTDQSLGDKNLGFLITYQVNDVDTTDNLVVTEKLNGIIIRTINGAPRNENLEIEITNEKLFSLPLNSENTIEIKVDDGQGGIAYRRYTFRRTNTAPIISGNDEDLGQKTEPFSIDFSVSDNEGNAIIVKTYLDGVQKEEYQAEDGATNTFTITKDDWFKLPIGQHSIKIEATDEHGATAIRNYTFERYDDKIQFTFKKPIETDIMASKILVSPTWHIPEGAIGKIEACNNGFDEEPTWEDITSQVLINRHYNFTNDTKTGDKWGINIRFTIEKGTATEQAIVNGFGGAFE